MRKIGFILGLVLMTSAAFSQELETSGEKTYDQKLIGCWKGFEEGQQQEGLNKYWVSCRFQDGTSTILFIAIDADGKVTQNTENGKWWVEDGKYYELHNVDNVTDVYDYEILEDSVKFNSVELMGKKDTTYSFNDYKIGED
jgi:hypothetical protein